jgi:Lrp/AsnC family transcriptional regulator, regulator for asnA, asnC and gidA
MRKPPLDELDVKILTQLQIDGRMPFTRIAEAVGVSEATVRARVARMTRRRTVKFVVDIDANELGLIEVYLGLRVQGPALERAVAAVAEIPEVPYSAIVSGPFDVMCEVVCRDNDDLIRLLVDIRKIAGVVSVDVITILKIHKDDWTFAALSPHPATE